MKTAFTPFHNCIKELEKEIRSLKSALRSSTELLEIEREDKSKMVSLIVSTVTTGEWDRLKTQDPRLHSSIKKVINQGG